MTTAGHGRKIDLVIIVGVSGVVISGPSADSRARRIASIVAGLLATAAVVAGSLVLIFSPSPTVRDSAVTITDTSENVEAGPSPGLTTTHTEEHTTAATDTSAIGRLFAAPGSQLLLSVGLVVLAGFLVGAFAQRVLLGEYALSVGPIEIPALTPITAAETTSAVAKITQSPTLQVAIRRVPGQVSAAPHPQFESIEDPRLKFLSIRTELEDRLRNLAQAVGIDRDVQLNRLVDRLRLEQVLDDSAAAGIKEFLDIGGRVARGAEVADDVVASIEGEASKLLYALAELAERRRSA